MTLTDQEYIRQLERNNNITLHSFSTLSDWDLNYENGYFIENDNIIGLRLNHLNLPNISNLIIHFPHITHLSLTNNKLNDISFLINFPNLSNLILSNNQITDITILSNLTNLTHLDLNINKLESFPILPNLKTLKSLFLNRNSISDISNISHFKYLEVLHLKYNDIESIESLSTITNLIELNLTMNKINKISSLGALTNLLNLSISQNQIDDCSIISNLKKLKRLELNHNKISNIQAIEMLEDLEYLNLWDNQKIDISPLSNLKKLTFLDLCDLGISNIDPLSKLINLTSLDIRSNEIEDISILHNLKNLRNLHLWHNRISDISVLASLKNLEVLELNGNRIKNFSPIENLTKLSELNLSECQLKDITFLQNLQALVRLNLMDNEISNLQPLSALNNLVRLNASFNRITILPEWLLNSQMENNFQGEEFLNGFNLNNNPIENVPMELLMQPKDSIDDYFKSLTDGSQPINEIKVILLGEGAAGKTSLMNYLQGKPYNKEEPQTHGINLKDCIEQAGVTMKVWDFGGQDIMHHTHQFFLTQKSVYVLVLNARENTDVEKWLKLIQVFGGDSPIIIVTNKIDENPSDHENIKYLNTKYPNLKNRYVRISCAKGIGLNDFKNLLSSTINELLHVRTLWGNSWLEVKKELEAMRDGYILKDYIHYDVYQEICDKHGVSKTHRDTLINWLHRLGVITYFPDTNLSETNVINPSWLTEAFYKIINSENVAKNFGRFNSSELEYIIDKDRYPKHKYGFLLGLMTKFELCYQIDQDRYLIEKSPNSHLILQPL
jgi:small GTP-binding protein